MRTGRTFPPSVTGTLLVQERNIFRQLRFRKAFYVSVYVGEFLVCHDLGPKRRHSARGRIAHESGEGNQRQSGLGQTRSRSASLPHVAVALVAAVPLKEALAVVDIAGLDLGQRRAGDREQ